MTGRITFHLLFICQTFWWFTVCSTMLSRNNVFLTLVRKCNSFFPLKIIKIYTNSLEILIDASILFKSRSVCNLLHKIFTKIPYSKRLYINVGSRLIRQDFLCMIDKIMKHRDISQVTRSNTVCNFETRSICGSKTKRPAQTGTKALGVKVRPQNLYNRSSLHH